MLIPREKTKDELQREEEEYQEFLRREVGEDLHQLIEVDQDIIGIHENALNGEGDGEGRKKKKKKDKGKEKEKGQSKAKEGKEKEDHEFLMKFAPLKPLLLHSKTDTSTPSVATSSTEGGLIGVQKGSQHTPRLPAYRTVRGNPRLRALKTLQAPLVALPSPRLTAVRT